MSKAKAADPHDRKLTPETMQETGPGSCAWRVLRASCRHSICLISGETRSAIGLFWTSWLMLVISVPSGAICGALFCTQLWPKGETNHVNPAIAAPYAQ